MSLTSGGPGSGTASRTGGGRSGNGTGSHTATGGGGINGGSQAADNSTVGSLCSSAPDAKRFLRLYNTAECQLCQTITGKQEIKMIISLLSQT